MTAWRKAVELIVTVLVVAMMTFAILGAILAEGEAESRGFTIGIVLFFGSFIKMGAVIFLRRRDGHYAAAAQDAHATVRLGRPVADVRAILVCFWLAAFGWSFIFIGQYGAGTSFDRFMLFTGLILFGGISIAMTRTFLRKGTLTLVLSPHGLQCNRFGDLTIAWPDIRSAELRGLGRFGSLKVIILKLVDEAKYLPRRKQPFWAWGDRLTLGTSFTIPLSLDVSSKLVLQAIRARLSAFGSAVSASSAMKENR